MQVIDNEGQTWVVFNSHARPWGRTLDLINTRSQVEIRDAPAEDYEVM